MREHLQAEDVAKRQETPEPNAVPTQLERSLKAAKRYRARGWEPMPASTDQAEKRGTRIPKWTDLSPEQLIKKFGKKHDNIGLRWHKSTEHCAVDLDCPEAVSLWRIFLPPTLAIKRKSKPISHLIYKCAVDKTPFGVLDLLGHGSFSLAPPSIHKSGERLEWVDWSVEPVQMEPDDLVHRVSLIAACSKILQHWKEHTRDELAFITCCLLQDAGAQLETTKQLINAFIDHGECDQKDRTTLKGKAQHVYSLKDNAKRKGIPALRKIVGEDADKVREWLSIDVNEPMLEPLDLWDAGNAPGFPLHTLPKNLRDRAVDVAERVSCPPELTVFPGLVAGCWAMGSSVRIQLSEADDEWLEPAIIYSFVAMPSGSAKSPAAHAMFKPLHREQRKTYAKFKKDLAAWEEKPAKGANKRGPMPQFANVITGDVTVEGLMAHMEIEPKGIMLAADELSGWLTGQNQYKGGKGNDDKRFLEFYDGEQANKTRVVDSKHLDRPQINIYGTIQPAILPVLYTKENLHAGLVPRFGLAAYPPQFTRKLSKKAVNKKARTAYTNQLLNLRRRCAPQLIIKMEDYSEFNAWLTKQYRQQSCLPEVLRIHFAKYPGLVGRLALALYSYHLRCSGKGKNDLYSSQEMGSEDEDGYRIADKKIPKQIIANAIEIIDIYLKSHAKRLYKSVDHVQGKPFGQRIAAEIILEDPMIEFLTVSNVIRRERTGLSSAEAIVSGFRYLEAMGWGQYDAHHQAPGKRGPRSNRFTINRAVFDSEWKTSE